MRSPFICTRQFFTAFGIAASCAAPFPQQSDFIRRIQPPIDRGFISSLGRSLMQSTTYFGRGIPGGCRGCLRHAL